VKKSSRGVDPGSPVELGANNEITDVIGVEVGQAERIGDGWCSGTTVISLPDGAVGAVDVRGGGPGTRETDLLRPGSLVGRIDAIVLSGGSAYGLDAAGGVMRHLEAERRGYRAGPAAVVPIVPAAVLFDLGRGGDVSLRPDAELGKRAAQLASAGPVLEGNVGAGTGAIAGSVKGGIGTASAVAGSFTIGVLVAVNCAGSVVDPSDGGLYGRNALLAGEWDELRVPSAEEVAAAPRRPFGEPAPFNTTLAVVATDAALDAAELHRLALVGHDGLARAIRPVHTLFDGDAVFAVATGHRQRRVLTAVELSRLGELGAVTIERAIVRAVLAARSLPELPELPLSYLDRYPSALGAGGGRPAG
jgi:L-aminopeptidase/D-esterase-like protein